MHDRQPRCALIIPVRNEALALPYVLKNVPAEIERVVVVDNGSEDDTAAVAVEFGAEVVGEPRPGYGRACWAGLAALQTRPPQVVAFADADGSDDLSCLPEFVGLIAAGRADLVLGRRVPQERRALTLLQRGGNRLVVSLIRRLWGYAYHDLGPMRAVRWVTLQQMNLRDRDYGWTIEMQVKAAKLGLTVREIDVPYRCRIAGRSKVSGTVGGSLRAGAKFLSVIGREYFIESHQARECSRRI